MNNKNDEYDIQGDPNNLGNDPEVPVVSVPPPEHPHRAAIEAHHRHHYIKRSAEFIREHWPSANSWSAFGSLITAIATIVMVVVYIQIKGIMTSQGGQTDKLITAANTQACAASTIAAASVRNAAAAEKFSESAANIRTDTQAAVGNLHRSAVASENAMRESSRNAQKALDASTNSLEISQRAWVGIQLVTGRVKKTDGAVTVAPVLIMKNTGQTPALNMSGTYMVTDRSYDQPIPEYDPEAEKRDLIDRIERIRRNWLKTADDPRTIADINRNFDRMISEQRIEEKQMFPSGDVLAPDAFRNLNNIADQIAFANPTPKQPPLVIYVIGRITYDDVFHKVRHTTKWCLMYRGIGDSMESCPEQNWMD